MKSYKINYGVVSDSENSVNVVCEESDIRKESKTAENNNQAIYAVKAFYDMAIISDDGEEIIHEIYATEQLAQQRVRQLIDEFKQYHTIEDCEPYGGEWDEREFGLFAYMDSEWNVDISYYVDIVRTKLDRP